MSITTKTSTENLNELLLDLAAEAAEWLELLEHNAQQSPERLIALIHAYHGAEVEHGKSEALLQGVAPTPVTTMAEIEEIKRREREERGEG